LSTTPDHAARIETALATGSAVRDAVVASWQRSKNLHRLDPGHGSAPERLSAEELSLARERLGSFIQTADASLDQLYLAVGNAGCCVLLADKNGIPVARRGARADDRIFDEWGLWTGALWSEDSEGTNGIGTCIVEERPLTVHKDQHFHSKNIDMSCTAAPIFDHEGKLLAAVDVSSCRADLTAGFSNLISIGVVNAAQAIETAHFRQFYSSSRILLAASANQVDTPGPALIAVDRDDLVIGATRQARRLYGLSDKDFKNPVPVSTLFDQDVDEADDYTKAGRRTVLLALARSGGNVSAAASSMGISRATLHRKIKRLGIQTRSN